MTEHYSNQPEYVERQPIGKIERMRAMLEDAGQGEDVDKDILLQHAAIFNQMLGLSDGDEESRGLSILFCTGADVFKNDAEGAPLFETDNQTKYGYITQCIVREDIRTGATQLLLLVQPNHDDLSEPGFEGGYSVELASFDDGLQLGEARIYEIDRPALEPDDDEKRIFNKSEQRLGERLNRYASYFDAWRNKYLSAEDPVPIATLLDSIIDYAKQLPEHEREQYVDEQVTAINLSVSSRENPATLMAEYSGVIEVHESSMSGRFEREYAINNKDMMVYALDVQWGQERLLGFLYGLDEEGSLVRCDLNSNLTAVQLYEDEEEHES